MSGVGKAIAAGLAGAAIGGLGAYADKKAADKAKTPSSSSAPSGSSAPSYSIAHKIRQKLFGGSSSPAPSSASSSTPSTASAPSSGADTQTPDTE